MAYNTEINENVLLPKLCSTPPSLSDKNVFQRSVRALLSKDDRYSDRAGVHGNDGLLFGVKYAIASAVVRAYFIFQMHFGVLSSTEKGYRNDDFRSKCVLCDYPSLRGLYFDVFFYVQRTWSQRRDDLCID